MSPTTAGVGSEGGEVELPDWVEVHPDLDGVHWRWRCWSPTSCDGEVESGPGMFVTKSTATDGAAGHIARCHPAAVTQFGVDIGAEGVAVLPVSVRRASSELGMVDPLVYWAPGVDLETYDVGRFNEDRLPRPLTEFRSLGPCERCGQPVKAFDGHGHQRVAGRTEPGGLLVPATVRHDICPPAPPARTEEIRTDGKRSSTTDMVALMKAYCEPGALPRRQVFVCSRSVAEQLLLSPDTATATGAASLLNGIDLHIDPDKSGNAYELVDAEKYAARRAAAPSSTNRPDDPGPRTLVVHPADLERSPHLPGNAARLGITVTTSAAVPDGTRYLMAAPAAPVVSLEALARDYVQGADTDSWYRQRLFAGVMPMILTPRVSLPGCGLGFRTAARRAWRPRPRPGQKYAYTPTPWLAAPRPLPIDGCAHRRRTRTRRTR